MRYIVLFILPVFILPGSALAKTSCGKASWYAMTSKTASGERASPHTMTAAHRTLPFGTRVRVTNLHNGRSAIVRINDRGPFIKGRVIDVTKRVAEKLGFRRRGWARVAVTRLGRKATRKTRKSRSIRAMRKHCR